LKILSNKERRLSRKRTKPPFPEEAGPVRQLTGPPLSFFLSELGDVVNSGEKRKENVL
jgi:hypothetical protein